MRSDRISDIQGKRTTAKGKRDNYVYKGFFAGFIFLGDE